MFENINDKEKYLIQPYIDGEKVKIKVLYNNGLFDVKQYNKNDKEIYIVKKIKDEILKCYKSSKFKGYDIILKGFIVKNYKNKKSLILYDIMTIDEYKLNVQSKRYSIRLENLNIRFLSPKLKNIKSIFYHNYSENNLSIIYNQFIKKNVIDGYVFHKNVPYKYEDNEIIIENNICKLYETNVIDFIFGTSIKQKIDEEKNKIEIVESIPCLAGVKIKHNDEEIVINLDNILDSEKIKYFNEINELKNKRIQFKEYNFLNEHDFIFINFK